MLISINVQNFLSFNNDTELTMIATNRIRKFKEHKIQINKLNLLKHGVIYGANASGKSNLIKALSFLKYTVEKSLPLESKNSYCRIDSDNSLKSSVFSVKFSINNKFYEYTIDVNLTKRIINKEYLVEMYSNMEPLLIFNRENNCTPEYGIEALKNLSTIEHSHLNTHLDDFDVTSDILFLTYFCKRAKINKDSNFIHLKNAYDWFTNKLIICMPDTDLTDIQQYHDEATLENINKIIKTIDAGITNVSLIEISEDELKNAIPSELWNKIKSDLKEHIEESDDREFRISLRSRNGFFTIMYVQGQQTIKTIRLTHETNTTSFNFSEESDGTRRFFELIDILLTKDEDTVYLVDEIERSLHPLLTQRFIEIFRDYHINQRIQLVFTTHETFIMNQDLFRRDEIWFVERNRLGASNIYSLDRFKERFDKILSKGYVDGRYGAIPILKKSYSISKNEI